VTWHLQVNLLALWSCLPITLLSSKTAQLRQHKGAPRASTALEGPSQLRSTPAALTVSLAPAWSSACLKPGQRTWALLLPASAVSEALRSRTWHLLLDFAHVICPPPHQLNIVDSTDAVCGNLPWHCLLYTRGVRHCTVAITVAIHTNESTAMRSKYPPRGKRSSPSPLT
jgi:hypothetical protein